MANADNKDRARQRRRTHMTETSNSQDDEALDWRDFLVDCPQGHVHALIGPRTSERNNSYIEFRVPELQLYWDGECQGVSYCKGAVKAHGTLFGDADGEPFPNSSRPPPKDWPQDALLRYVCEKCGRVIKSYDMRLESRTSSTETALVVVQKLSAWLHLLALRAT